jgi:hypothetical protein
MSKLGRNDPCPCGSGRKFKQCCLNKPPEPLPEAPPTEVDKLKQQFAELKVRNEEYAKALYQKVFKKLGRKPTNKEWDRALLADRDQSRVDTTEEMLSKLDSEKGKMYAYAYKKVGFLIVNDKMRKQNPLLAARWDEACAEYQAFSQMFTRFDSAGTH